LLLAFGNWQLERKRKPFDPDSKKDKIAPDFLVSEPASCQPLIANSNYYAIRLPTLKHPTVKLYDIFRNQGHLTAKSESFG